MRLCLYVHVRRGGGKGSLVPRPSPAPVIDRCKRSKTGAGEGLGTRLGKGTQHEISPRTCFTLGIRWPAFP